jgi:FkbH-like protein
MDSRALFKQVTSLRREARHRQALELLREPLRRGELDAQAVEKAGGIINNALENPQDLPIYARVALLGQCTTSWLANSLTAVAWGRGATLPVADGAYDNVLQELLATSPAAAGADVFVLLPWHQRLFSAEPARSPEQRVRDELAFWEQVWKRLIGHFGKKIVQVGYDWTAPGALGHCLGGGGEGNAGQVRRLNDELRRHLPDSTYFLDLEQVSGWMGRDRFYDPRRYFWTKQPFSEDGAGRLAEHLWAGVRAIVTGPKKVLVVDLDNTLWGGVVGETGPLGVELGEGPDGEAFRAFQAHLKDLSKRGVAVAVCSKNNPSDARGPFEQNPAMVLSLDDIAHFEASWEPKTVGIQKIAETLQLGLDSFVFFDDSPAEREHIRQALPEVEVVEVAEDPAEFIRALDRGLWFETARLTGEDRRRSEQYRVENQRRAAQASFASMDQYLASLAMVADVRPIGEADLDRVVQLIGKTNQFNLTTRRHGLPALRKLLDQPESIGLTLRLKDRFGDYGLISVLIAVADGQDGALELTIDTWLMSCRVIGRTAEEFLFNQLCSAARGRGVERLIGCYISSPKNGLVQNLYDRLGFRRRGQPDNGTVVYDLELAQAPPARTLVQSVQARA